MSIGNLKDQGNKGNNFPYQLKTLQLLGAISNSISAIPGVDHESRTSTYQAIANGVGYFIGNIIIRYDIIDLGTGLIDTTLWFNDTLQTQLIPAPLPGDLTPISAPSGVTVLNGTGGAAVNIQDGGNSITVDATSLPLPTGAATETTLSALNTQFTAITRIPSITRATSLATISAGARSISVYNAGSATGSVLGGTNNILPGEIFNFDAGGENDTLAAFAYDATGTTLVITTIV